MNTNEQFHQSDGLPPNFPINVTEEKQVKQDCGSGEMVGIGNPPDIALARLADQAATAKTTPKLANQFASLDAEQTKKMFADISEAIRDNAEVFVFACKGAADSWDALTPHLSQMQSLLSQRGEQRQAFLREAGLPTWTGWFEDFKKDLRLKISLRAVQKKLAQLRDKSVGGKNHKTLGRGNAAKADNKKTSNLEGAKAETAEAQEQLKVAVDKQATLAERIADLEKENEKLQGIANDLKEQLQESREKAVGKLPSHVEKRKEFAKLADKAFEIINGRFGERLMGSPEGKRLVELAKKASAIKRTGKTC